MCVCVCVCVCVVGCMGKITSSSLFVPQATGLYPGTESTATAYNSCCHYLPNRKPVSARRTDGALRTKTLSGSLCPPSSGAAACCCRERQQLLYGRTYVGRFLGNIHTDHHFYLMSVVGIGIHSSIRRLAVTSARRQA